MSIRIRLILISLVLFATLGTLAAQTVPRVIDAHLHHNGDPAFLEKLVAKLDSVDGLALVITWPKDMDSVKGFIAKHPNRIMGLGDLSLDDPLALELVDRFHAAGFRGLGELTGPLKNYDDRSYWPIYERAEKYGMIILFHTGIVIAGRTRRFPRTSAWTACGRRLSMASPGASPSSPSSARTWGIPTMPGPRKSRVGIPTSTSTFQAPRSSRSRMTPLSGRSIFWWSGIVSPHTPANAPNAFERLVFGSDVFNGELEEFDRQLERYHKMLDACGVPKASQQNIFAGTMWKILSAQK